MSQQKMRAWCSAVACLFLLAGCAAPGQENPTTAPNISTPSIDGLITPTPIQPASPVATTVTPPTSPALPSPTATFTASPEPTVEVLAKSPVLVGAGDISICGQDGDDATARLLASIEGTIFTAGDNSNEDGTMDQYLNCFGPGWGEHKDRIRPAPGNHEYKTGDAGAYFDYFGEAAGPQGQGYYSYDLGEWHIVVLNSNCLAAGCAFDSVQVQWLREDLAANDSRCTLAYWHHPRWSSGLAGSSPWLAGFWDTLYEYGAEVVISGHDHSYERFAPQDPNGQLDEARGIRQFVVGTGGASQRGFLAPLPNSEVRNTGAYGVIKFTLHPDSYDWEFIPVEGGTFTDAGSGVCHE